jgi:signal transduction histidine kinase
MPLHNRLFIRSTTSLLFVGLVCLIGIVGANFWLTERAQVYFDSVTEARAARAAAVELRSELQTAESSQRGFLVTGNEIYLAPYEVANSLVERQLASTQAKFAGYGDLATLIERINSVVGQKTTEMKEIINLKRQRRDDEAIALFRTNRGKALMDEANVLLSGAIKAAELRLIQGISEHARNAQWLRWVSIVGGAIIIAVVAAAAFAVFRYTRELSEAREEVSALNADLEDRVKERTAQLAHANDEVQRFAYIVTHDLRAPLVNIMGFTSELEDSVGRLQALIDKTDASKDLDDPVARDARHAATEDFPEAIRFIRSSTRKMDNLINAILRISREGRRALRPELVDVNAALQSSLSAIGHQLSTAGGSVNVDVDIPAIATDRLAFDHIIGNLLDNAVKYRSPQRTLAIRISVQPSAGNQVKIRIKDNGRGIAQADLERVFELFRRAGSQDQPGEGIGLASVKILARRLGGDVTVSSTMGEGTVFEVTLAHMNDSSEGVAA